MESQRKIKDEGRRGHIYNDEKMVQERGKSGTQAKAL